jgi:hypothetical protein
MLSAPFVALSMALAVMNARGALLVFAIATPILAIPSVADGYCDPWAWRLHSFPFEDAIRETSERDSIARRVGVGFAVVELINSKVPPRGLVFATGPPMEAYLNRDDMVGYESALGETLTDMLLVASVPDYAPSWILTFHFPERQCRRLRIVQTATGGADDEWRIGELKLYRAGVELPPTKQWRLSANANKWDVGYVLDSNPATRWRAGAALVPGQQFGLDFGKLETIDTVELDCSHDEYAIRLKLETEDTPGHWTTLAAAPQLSNRPVTGNARRSAIEQFKLHGITHILVHKDDYFAPDFQKNTSEWGLTLIGKAGDNWLYEIE